jgi:hypothetical protein
MSLSNLMVPSNLIRAGRRGMASRRFYGNALIARQSQLPQSGAASRSRFRVPQAFRRAQSTPSRLLKKSV